MAVGVEALQRLGLLQSVFADEAGHHASRFLRPEAVEAQLAATLFLEGDVDHAPVAQRLAVERLPIFLAGNVDDHRLGLVAKVRAKPIRPRFAPPGIENLLSAPPPR